MSLELRWFFLGQIRSDVEKWFQKDRFGKHLHQKMKRQDLYFPVKGADHLGVKLSRGKLDLKIRLDSQGVVGSKGEVKGVAEYWKKMSWAYSPTLKNDVWKAFSSIEFDDRIVVEKERFQRKFKIKNDSLEPIKVSERHEKACALEITKLTVLSDAISERYWWTIALEVFGETAEAYEHLHESIDWVFKDYPEPKPQTEQTYAFPRWVLSFYEENRSG